MALSACSLESSGDYYNQRPHTAIVLGLCEALLSGGAIANYTKCLPADDCQAAVLSFAISNGLTSHAADLSGHHTRARAWKSILGGTPPANSQEKICASLVIFPILKTLFIYGGVDSPDSECAVSKGDFQIQ